MNQPESMNPGLTWPAPLGLGGLQLQASASRSISQKMSLQITVNFQTQVIFRIYHFEPYPIATMLRVTMRCYQLCYQASCAGSISHKIMSSRISLRYSMNIRMSRGFLGSCHWQKLADDQTIIRWQPEIKRKHMEHWNIASILIRSSVKGQGSRFFEVSDGQCQNHLEIPWIQHSALPARRPWWHRDWGCEGTWTARSSACSLHSG